MNNVIRSILVAVERLPVGERSAFLAEITRRYADPSKPKLTHPVSDEQGTLRCPRCDNRIWDNRRKIERGEFPPKSPTFACQNKVGCGWTSWHKHDAPTEPNAKPQRETKARPVSPDEWWADGRRRRRKPQSFDEWQQDCRKNEPPDMPF